VRVGNSFTAGNDLPHEGGRGKRINRKKLGVSLQKKNGLELEKRKETVVQKANRIKRERAGGRKRPMGLLVEVGEGASRELVGGEMAPSTKKDSGGNQRGCGALDKPLEAIGKQLTKKNGA